MKYIGKNLIIININKWVNMISIYIDLLEIKISLVYTIILFDLNKIIEIKTNIVTIICKREY